MPVKKYNNVAYFNPRSYKRSDNNVQIQEVDYGDISIHAPTRGATIQHEAGCQCDKYFNPRSYKRSDPMDGSVR